MKLSVHELIKRGFVKNANGSWSKPSLLSHQNVPPRIPDPKPERHAGRPLVDPGKNEEKGKVRLVVRITGHRIDLLDPDNFAGGCKYLIDQLRYSGLIPEDNPDAISLITTQLKVTRKEDEGTEIEISEERPAE